MKLQAALVQVTVLAVFFSQIHPVVYAQSDRAIADSNQVLDRIPHIVQESANVQLDKNLKHKKDNREITLPQTSNEPAKMELQNGKKLEISMPIGKRAERGNRIRQGVVEYKSQDSFHNVAQVTETGDIRFMSIIKDRQAPERYEYKVEYEGGKVIINEAITPEGKKGLVILNSSQEEVLAFIDAAWAKDGSGKELKTWYTVQGNRIIQTVKHRVAGTVYPVVADPFVEHYWWGQKLWYKRQETKIIANWMTFGGIISGPIFPWIGAASSGLGWWIQGMYDRGNCVAASQIKTGQITYIWEWKNQHCW